MSDAYRQAGVDTEAGQDFVRLIKPAVATTFSPEVMGGLGGFAALFDASLLKRYDSPVLVSSTDGVGTKLTLARLFDRHETIGLDLVAMCANDLLVSGATPLFLLDYVAVGRLNPEHMKTVVESIAAGCRLARCSLVGGETAEHPGVMKDEEYDLAGFVVGVVEKSALMASSRVREGDVIIGLPSSGVHSNGVSLIRKIFLEDGALPAAEQDWRFLRDRILLSPTILYEEVIREIIRQGLPTGMVHVTGGGFYENVPRILGDGLCAELRHWPLPEPFATIQARGDLTLTDMHSVFNCGYGYLVLVRPEHVEQTLQLARAGLDRYRSRLLEEMGGFPALDPGVLLNDTLRREPAVLGAIRKRTDEAAVVFT